MAQHDIEDEVFTGRIDWSLWRRLLAHARPYRRFVAGMAASGAVIAVCDALFPLLTGLIIDEAITEGLSTRLKWLVASYAATMALFATIVWFFIICAGRIATGVAYDLRTRSFGRLQELSFGYFDRRPVGWLVTRLTSDCERLSSLLPWFSLDLVWGSCLLVGIGAIMLWLHATLALWVALVIPPLAIATWFIQKRLLRSSRQVRRTNAQITASFNEAIGAVRTTKSLAREESALEEFDELAGAMRAYSVRNALQAAVYLPVVISLGSIGVGIALWRGGVDVQAGGLTLGTLVAFMQYATLFAMPIEELARRFTELQSAQAAAERVQGLLDTVPEIADDEAVRHAIAEQEARPVAGRAIDGGRRDIEAIEFRDVGFWYTENEPVLADFDLHVERGRTIALVGPTGGGKSTIVSLLARFYEPRTGAILLDGVEYRARSLHWLQSSLGVVLQTPHLFSGTLRENVRYGRLDATDAEIEAAARLAGADAVVEEVDGGWEAEVGEGGANLSTGQRQLVALARAVLADPEVFILDEATSAVDTLTEKRIQAGIDRVLEHRTAFVIAHRLSTIRNADEILFIDGGRIIERGTHRELLSLHGRYAELHREHRIDAELG